jgi:hypothetical protein
MTSLLNLTARAVDLATLPTRFALKTLLRFVRDDAADTPPPPVAEAPPPQRERNAPVARRRPKAASRPQPPSRTQVAREQRVTHPPQPPGGPGPEIHVAEPWKGYDAMTEDEVLERLVGADPTLRAAVRLYESTHGGRRQVLLATEETVVQP